MVMGETISDWIIALNKAGNFDLARAFASKKIEDYERLKSTGLPVLADFKVPFARFNEKNKRLGSFLGNHNQFVVRAIPNTNELPRRYEIGVETIDDCLAFLGENVRESDENKYTIFLTEYEPTSWSGITIADDNGLLVDVSRDGLDKLSHGLAKDVFGGFMPNYGVGRFKVMSYEREDVESRGVMLRALNAIRKNSGFILNDGLEGYFEFVVTEETNRLVFVDYKVNSAYRSTLRM
jgi:hypothetical protein